MSSIAQPNVSALMPEESSAEIISSVEHTSAALRLMRNARMSTTQYRMPVMSALPQASFVSAGGGLKSTTKAAWKNKFLNAEEIACIVPIPEAYLDDANFDIWAELRPKIAEAIAVTLDAAVFFGVNKPASWGDAIITHAENAGNSIVQGAVVDQDIAGDISDLMGLVETDGFDVNGFVSRRALRSSLRNLRTTEGQPIFVQDLTKAAGTMLYGETLNYIPDEAFDTANAKLLTGDWMQAIIATRQDITYKILTEASLFDDDGNLLFNLAQQDMVALRIVARYAYEVANAVNLEGDIDDQSPFGVLRPTGWS